MHAPTLLERFHTAMNRHDLDAFVACFQPDFDSQQPAHPDRHFAGSDQVRKNWTRMFEGIPDFEGDLLRSTVTPDTIWSEWDWHGTRSDGQPFHVAANIIFGVRDDRFAWARLYMDSVETEGLGIDVQLRNWTGKEEGK